MTDREQGILDLVMHNVLIFLLLNHPLSARERRTCYSRLSTWLQPEVNKATLWAKNASGAAMRMDKPWSKTRQLFKVQFAVLQVRNKA